MLNDPWTDADPIRAGYTIRARLQMFLETVDGTFHVRDVYEALDARTNDSKNRVRQAIHREANGKEKTIESTGKYGCWRKIDKTVEWSDLSIEEDGGPMIMNLHMPLGIGHLVGISPGDVIGVAGETSTGKTGFACEFSLENLEEYTINYFSSEVTKAGMQDKAKKDRVDLKRLKNLRFGMRYDHYEDVIVGGEINVVDYLKAPDIQGSPGYFAIPHLINKIHKALNGEGVCLVCLQKDHGSQSGEGGPKTRHATNLYITLDSNQKTRECWATIIKCKVRPDLEGYRIKYRPRPFGLDALTDWLPPK